MNDKFSNFSFYVITNIDGKFFNREKSQWFDDLSESRIYTKIGPARGVITFLKKYKSIDAQILKLGIGKVEILTR